MKLKSNKQTNTHTHVHTHNIGFILTQPSQHFMTASCVRSSSDKAYDTVKPQVFTWSILLIWTLIGFEICRAFLVQKLQQRTKCKSNTLLTQIGEYLRQMQLFSINDDKFFKVIFYIGLIGFLTNFLGIFKDLIQDIDPNRTIYWIDIRWL